MGFVMDDAGLMEFVGDIENWNAGLGTLGLDCYGIDGLMLHTCYELFGIVHCCFAVADYGGIDRFSAMMIIF